MIHDELRQYRQLLERVDDESAAVVRGEVARRRGRMMNESAAVWIEQAVRGERGW